MKNNEYHITTVEVYYNGSEEKFDNFLKAVVRDYISEDKTLPNDTKITNKKSA